MNHKKQLEGKGVLNLSVRRSPIISASACPRDIVSMNDRKNDDPRG